MAIDVFTEEIVSLSQAAKRLPKVRGGKHLHVTSLYRWIANGKRSPDGSMVRLESVKIGGTVCTSLEALQRYFDRLTGDHSIVSPPTITERQRLKRMAELEAEAERLGI